ncbi:ABC transporter permease [Spongorhabdus nitratireducens]
MLRLVSKLLLSSLCSLLLMGVLVFMLVEKLPGDACTALLAQDAQPERIEQCRKSLGLDLPSSERFVVWASNLLKGDLGWSLAKRRPVSEIIWPRLSNTLLLGTLAALLSIPLAIVLGFLAGLRPGRKSDNWISLASIGAMALPEFVVALGPMYLFSFATGWLPAVSLLYDAQPVSEQIQYAILPALSIALLVNAHIMRTVRSATIHVMNSHYIQMARFKGVTPTSIVLRHAVRPTLAPCTGTLSLYMAWIFCGVVVVEKVFNYPGLGMLLVNAICERDYPVIQVTCMLMTLICIACSFCGDLCGQLFDPRQRECA